MAEEVRGSQESQLMYKKTSGFADIAGQMYEIKMSALMFTRCLLAFSKVHLGTNMEAAKPLDDIVLKVESTPVLMQLKHFKDKKFYISHLMQPKSKFNLIQCYRDYCSVKNSWKENKNLQALFPFEDAVIVLYTNAVYNHEISENVNNEWQGILNTGGKFFSFTKETHPVIFEMFENLSLIQNLLNSDSDDVNSVKLHLEIVQILSGWSMSEKKHLIKIINELDDMGEINNFKKFMSQVWLFTDQANEQNLDSLIQSELGKLLAASDLNLTNCYSKFIENIQKWWRCDRGYVLTEECKFWKQITEGCVCRHTDLRVLELEGNLKFSETELHSFRASVFADDVSKLKIVIGSPALLTAMKMHSSLLKENHILVDINMHSKQQQEVMILWSRWCNVLVLIVSNLDDDWEINSFLKILKANPRKMLFLVGCISLKTINHLKSKKIIFHMVEDHFNVTQLDCKSYANVQNLSVKFQGQDVAFREIMYFKHLTGKVLMHLLSKENHIIGSCLEDMIHYFIPRTLKRMDVVDNKILLSDSEDHFIVGGTTELQRYVPEDKRICIYRQGSVNGTLNQFIQVDESFTENDFVELCTIHKNQNFHWLNIEENNKIVWQKSKRNTALVAQYLQDISLYTYVYNIKDCLVIIVAEPGMGKTVLFSSIAWHLKKQQPNMWVINIFLNNHTDYLSQVDSTAIGLLEISAGIKNAFEREIFHDCLNFTKNIIVLLDGFDEISPGNSDKVLNFVKVLVSEIKLKQVWISSRPTMKQMLENALSSFAFELVPFSREEQELFLEKYWNICHVEKFIGKLLDLIATNISDQLGQFAGIPLQLQMLGEVFRKDMQHFRNTGIIRLPNMLDLLQLYEMFVTTKWEIYLRDKTKAIMTNEAQKKINSKLRTMFIEQHEICALFMLFNDEEFSLLPDAFAMKTKISTFIEELQSGEERTGIITDFVNRQLIFIHRSFLEYFAALWLARKFKEVSHILKDKIFDHKFKNVMIFFDRMLAQGCCLHNAIMNADLKLVEDLLKKDPSLNSMADKGGRTALHAAVITCSGNINNDNSKEVCYKILDVILDAEAELNKSDEVLLWRPLRYADALSAWKVVGILLREGADSGDLVSLNSIIALDADEADEYEMEGSVIFNDDHSFTEALSITAREGYFELLQFFVSKGIDIEKQYIWIHISFSVYNLEAKMTLLQASSFWGHVDIVSMLLKIGAVVDACGHLKMTALMWATMGGHIEIIQLLLHHGANYNAQSFVFPRYLSKIPTWRGIRSLNANLNLNFSLLNIFEDEVCEKGCTVLHLAVIFCQTKAVDILLKYKADVNIKDDYGYTELHFAAEVGDQEIADMLLENGAFIDERNKWRQTPLHISVANYNFEMAEYLISKGADIDKTDIDGYTYLDLLAYLCMTDCVKRNNTPWLSTPNSRSSNPPRYIDMEAAIRLVKYGTTFMKNNIRVHIPLHIAAYNANIVPLQLLIQCGALINSEDVNGTTALHLAALSTHKTLAVAEYLIEKGASVNKTNKIGWSPLHYTINSNKLDLVAVLIEHGALINQQDNDGVTPLHIAATKGHLESVEFLIQNGASVNDTNLAGEIPLHHSVLTKNVIVIEYLINKGACVNQGDLHNKSPLHLASEHGLLNIAQVLLQHGAVINSVTVNEDTALHFAAAAGHQHITEMLLRAGCCINKINKCGFTPLHLAVAHREELIYLIQQGADINQRDINGRTALHVAAFRSSLDVVQWLVEQGLSLNERCNHGKVPLHFALDGQNYEVIKWILKCDVDMVLTQNYINLLLQYATFADEPERIRSLVHQGGNINKRFFKGTTLLHKAAQMGHLSVIEVLMNLGANMNLRCDDGRTALHFAAYKGYLNIVQWLVKHGCSLKVRSNNGTTPLHLAAKGGHLDVVHWLNMQGASLCSITNDGQTVMHFAAQGGGLEMISWLRSSSVSLYDKCNDGRGVIHFLAVSDDMEVIQSLVGAEGINLHEKTRDGATLMHFTLQNKYIAWHHFHWLRNNGFSLHDECSDGKTFVHFAAFGNSTSLWWLEQEGINWIDWEKPCADGRTPVHFAAQGGALLTLEELKRKGCSLSRRANDGRTAVHFAALGGQMPVIQWLLHRGCDLHESTYDNRTVLHFAAEGGHLELLKWLIKQNVNVQQKSKEGISVLHAAARGGCVHALRWLVRLGSDLNETSCDNRTVLHFAAEGGNLRAVQWLVKQGLNVHQKAANGSTPFDCAVTGNNIRVADWLFDSYVIKMTEMFEP